MGDVEAGGRAVTSHGLRIGLVAPPWVPVPPPQYGGTEGVVDTLARGLVAQSHHVILFTVGDSTCPVPRAWVYRHPYAPMGATTAELYQVASAYDVLAGCDVVHDHTDAGPLWAGGRPGMPPVVTTIHNEFTRERRGFLAAVAKEGVAVVAISQDHASRASPVPVAGVVHHGLDLERFPFGTGEGGYALFVGRFSREKGAHRAIAIARRAGVPLLIASKMREPAEKEYFQRWIRPMLGLEVSYLGEVSARVRNRYLRDAVALVNPIQWPEPFGLVMIEALACGTPVIAFPSGAAPEIVRHGETGFLVRDVAAGARALQRVGEIDRATCRRDAERRFGAQRMVTDYVNLYRRVIARHGAPPASRAG